MSDSMGNEGSQETLQQPLDWESTNLDISGIDENEEAGAIRGQMALITLDFPTNLLMYNPTTDRLQQYSRDQAMGNCNVPLYEIFVSDSR